MGRENFRLVLTTSVCTAIVVSVLTFGAQAWANLDNNPATDSLPRIVPYEGVLDLDGAPFTGFMDMRFTFYDAPTGGNAVWTETWGHDQQRAVQVFRGRFSAALGTFDDGGPRPLEEVISDAGPTYLAIEVKQTDAANDAWVGLAGRQRLNPVPYAIWSAKASDLTVAGSATVRGSTTLSGTLDVTGNTRLSALAVSGATQLTGATTVDGALTANGAISNANGDVNIADGLNVTGSVSNSAGDVTLNDNTAIVGNLSLTGNVSNPNAFAVSVADDLEVTGTVISLGRNDGRPIGVNTAQRALVHGSPSDTLVVNYNGDFEGGTQINGNVVATGSVDVRGGLSNGAANAALAVNDDLTVTGNVNLNDCRLCLLYGDNCNLGTNNCDADKAYTCVQLRDGAISPLFQLSTGSVDSTDGFKLLFTCDGGNNNAATNRGRAPNEGNWPGPAN